MDIPVLIIVVSLILFAAILLVLNIGKFLGRLNSKEEEPNKGLGALEGAIYGLLGLLIAFTFSGAASRFDARRQLITSEANAIGTAYLRLDILSPEQRKPLQEKFRNFLDTRMDSYKKIYNHEESQKKLDLSKEILSQIWTDSVLASKTASYPQAPMLLLPAINEVIDITEERTAASKVHPPMIVFWMLGGLTIVSALLIGYGMALRKNGSWLHMILFSALLAFIFYVILDLEYPRRGLIRIDAADQLLQAARDAMNN